MSTAGAERSRTVYGWLAAAGVVFVICGSLVPFQFESVPLAEVPGRFTSALWQHLPISSRSDLVANVLLMMPVAFCMGGVFGRVSTRRRAIAAVTIVTAACAALSLSMEFLQTFLPSRVVSLRDVLAESGGALLGSALWVTLGTSLTDRVRACFRGRRRLHAAERWLLAYIVLLAAWNVRPLDLSIEPSVLFHKYREGVLVTGLTRAGHGGASASALLAWALDALLWLPVGVAASRFWRPRGFRRALPVALAMGAAAAGAMECSHIFLESRSVDLQAMLADAMGACAGSVAAAWLSRRTPAAPIPGRLAWAFGTLGWAALIVCAKWYPFNFVPDGTQALARVERLASWSSFTGDGSRTTAVVGTFLLTVPLGILLRGAVGRGGRIGASPLIAAMVFVVCLWTGVELGMALLPAGAAGLTQVPAGTCGGIVGLWLGGGWR